jgi:oligoendopeptidase F
MSEPPWKRLVEELKDEGYESIYLDRLRANLDVEQQHGILEKEIVQEMAYALGKSAAKVDHALLELELLENEIERCESEEQRASLERAIRSKRHEALQRRRDLLIHREALGIRRNDILERLYPIKKSGTGSLPKQK